MSATAREAAAARDRAARRRLADDPVYQIKQRRTPHGAPLSDAAMEAVRNREQAVDLTRVERETLQLAADGCSNPEIAVRLGKSVHTVKSQLKVIFRRLGARDRANAVAIALRRGEIV